MLNIFNNISISNAIPQIHMLHTAADSSIANFNISPYFEDNSILYNLNTFSEDYPTCSLSGRIKVNTDTMGSDSFRKFIGKNKVEMSEKQDLIEEFVNNVRKANYTTEMLSNKELPYLALAGFDNLSASEIADPLLWSQLIKDYPDSGLEILPLLDDNGQWTIEAHEVLYHKTISLLMNFKSYYSADHRKKLLTLVQKIPLSQRVWLKFKSPPRERFISGLLELSREAFRAFLSLESNRQFNVDPCIGPISKEDILEKLDKDLTRPVNVPFLDLIPKPTIDGEEVTMSQFAGHDWSHWLYMHLYSTELVEVFREILRSFKEMTKEPMSKEMWDIADFAFGALTNRLENSAASDKFVNLFINKEINFEKLDINEEFDLVLQENPLHVKSSLWAWHILFYFRDQRDYLQARYKLSIDKIPQLTKLNQLVECAEPFLQGYSNLERIYLLQKLVCLNETSWMAWLKWAVDGPMNISLIDFLDKLINPSVCEKNEMDNFFQAQPKVPELKIERIKYKNTFFLGVKEIHPPAPRDL